MRDFFLFRLTDRTTKRPVDVCIMQGMTFEDIVEDNGLVTGTLIRRPGCEDDIMVSEVREKIYKMDKWAILKGTW